MNMRRTVRRADTHINIFEERDYMFLLEADVAKAIEGVIVEPQRIELIETSDAVRHIECLSKRDQTYVMLCCCVGNFGEVYKGILDGNHTGRQVVSR